MKKYTYLLMMGFFFAAFQVAEVEAQRGDPGIDARDPRGGDMRDPRGDPGRDPRLDTRDPRGPANPPDRGATNPPDTRGGDTASDDRPWRAILKNCREMKQRGEKLTKPMRQECKAARRQKKESRR